MRADGVVDFLPVAEFTVEFFHLQRAGRDLVELLGVGAIGAFDGTASAAVVQFKIHIAGVLNRPVGNYRHASPYSYGFQ